jgi:hypothetical protein
MSRHPLSRIPILGQFVDERFLQHRRRASSVAGIAAAILAIAIFEYRLFRFGIWNWDLVIVAVAFVALKMTLFLWYRMRD